MGGNKKGPKSWSDVQKLFESGKLDHVKHTFNSSGSVTFEGAPESRPSMLALNAVADGLSDRFRRSSEDTITFRSGSVNPSADRMISGIEVSAERSGNVNGNGEGFTGWMKEYKGGKIVSEGPFSASITAPPPAP